MGSNYDERVVGEALRRTALAFGVEPGVLKGPRRFEKVRQARCAAYLLLREVLGLSYPQIAQALGRKNHTTVISGCKTAVYLRETSLAYKAKFAVAWAACLDLSSDEVGGKAEVRIPGAKARPHEVTATLTDPQEVMVAQPCGFHRAGRGQPCYAEKVGGSKSWRWVICAERTTAHELRTRAVQKEQGA